MAHAGDLTAIDAVSRGFDPYAEAVQLWHNSRYCQFVSPRTKIDGESEQLDCNDRSCCIAAGDIRSFVAIALHCTTPSRVRDVAGYVMP